MEDIILQKLNDLEDKIKSFNLCAKEILSLDDAATYLQVSKSHLYKLTSSKAIGHTKPTGKLIYFRKIDLDEWMLSNRELSLSDVSNNVLSNLQNRNNVTGR